MLSILCGLNSPYSQNRTQDAAIQALEIQFSGNSSGEIQFLEENGNHRLNIRRA